jgi:hypothetical protein
MLTIIDSQFVTGEGKELGVFATFKRGRWQYRNGPKTTDQLIASGMKPSLFTQTFWMRNDFEESN